MNSTTNIHIHTTVPVSFKRNPISDDIIRLTFGESDMYGTTLVLDSRTLSNLRRALADFTQTERDPDSLRRRPRKAAQ